MEPRQFDPAVPVGGPHHGDVSTDVVEADGLADPRSLDRRLAFDLHADLGEERPGGVEVLDHDEDAIHPMEPHGSSIWSGQEGPLKWASWLGCQSSTPESPVLRADRAIAAHHMLGGVRDSPRLLTALATVLPAKLERRNSGQAAINTLHDLGSHDACSHGVHLADNG